MGLLRVWRRKRGLLCGRHAGVEETRRMFQMGGKEGLRDQRLRAARNVHLYGLVENLVGEDWWVAGR